jgi:hypothetical protein
MATTATLRWRRSAAQLHALAKVEREIRATDPNGRRKYLREFSGAFPSYHSVLSQAQLEQTLTAADILLVGDYHALAACQRYCAQLLADLRRQSARPLVLGVEAVFSRDQHILEEWLRGEIDENELRERIRYDVEWQYDWTPFYEVLQSARAYGAKIYGLDCMPRGDMRKIYTRDRHAAAKIAEIRGQNPQAQIVVLFGESHLAPQHLPMHVRELPGDRVLTVLQNLDALYWKAAGERNSRVEAVRVAEDAICVFNATPLEKYESYRLYLGRWRCDRRDTIDFAPVFYNLIDALLRFLGIDKYRIRGAAPIVDLLPEVCSRSSPEALRKVLLRKKADRRELQQALDEVEAHGSCYVQRLNTIFASQLNMPHATEIAARFVRLACTGALTRPAILSPLEAERDRFYRLVLENALDYLGSRILYPARRPVRESDYYALYLQPREVVSCHSLCTYREYLEMLDFLILHKDYEAHRSKYWHPPQLVEQAMQFSASRLEFTTAQLGLMLGTDLYDSYVSGKLAKRSIRALYFRDLLKPGRAYALYFGLVSKVARPRRTMAA